MFFFFFCHGPPSTVIYTLSLHDALPIYKVRVLIMQLFGWFEFGISLGLNQPILFLCVHYYSNQCTSQFLRSEEHTSELQSRGHLVCRLLLEKKKKKTTEREYHTQSVNTE